MRLDSFGYRLLWNMKRALRFQDYGPHPIIKKKPRCFEAPSDLRRSLNEAERQRLNLILKELEFLSSIYDYLPQRISAEQWKQLLKLRQLRERFEFVTFLRQKELRSEKDEKKRVERVLHNEEARLRDTASDENNGEQERDEATKEPDRSFIFCAPNLRVKWQRQLECMRYLNVTRCEETPKLIIDCRFLSMHSFRGMNLALKQLAQLISENRRRQVPWPLFFANFDDSANEKLANGRRKFLPMIDSGYASTVSVSSSSCIEMFPRKFAESRLIYLSPHASEILETIDVNSCYIIGGIVDRVAEPGIPNKASLLTAETEGLPCFRLPINENLEWKSGNQMLTITGVASILADAFHSEADWKSVLERHIPSRKLRAPEERNPLIKSRYKNLSLFKKDVLRIMIENSSDLDVLESLKKE